MSKESIVAGAAATGILGSAIGVGVKLYGSSFRLEQDHTFNFNLQTYPELSIGRDKFDFEIFGFDAPNTCAKKLLVNGDIDISTQTKIQKGDVIYTPPEGVNELEPTDGCLIADILYSNREENGKKEGDKATAITAKFELAAVDKEKKNAVVVWIGLTNTSQDVEGIQTAHRVMRLSKQEATDNSSAKWVLKDGYEFKATFSTESKITFEKFGGDDATKNKFEINNACKKDGENRKCENIEKRLWRQKKGAWTWKASDSGKGIIAEPGLTIKFGDNTKVFFLGQQMDDQNKPTLSRIYKDSVWISSSDDKKTIDNKNVKSPFKKDTNKGTWKWLVCPETSAQGETQWGICSATQPSK